MILGPDGIARLECPACNQPAIPAHGRGRLDRDGNYVEHRDGCRCPHCDWMWFDDRGPVTCSCGVKLTVEVDDSHAYVKEGAS